MPLRIAAIRGAAARCLPIARAGAGERRQNLLNARDRLGIVAADVAEHGPEVIEQLRDLVHFRKLATERNTQTRRKPRALRLKDVLKAMDDQPIDINNPLLPPKHRERWLKGIEALSPRSSYDFSPSELAALLGADLASWFERHARGVSSGDDAHS